MLTELAFLGIKPVPQVMCLDLEQLSCPRMQTFRKPFLLGRYPAAPRLTVVPPQGAGSTAVSKLQPSAANAVQVWEACKDPPQDLQSQKKVPLQFT